MSDIVLYQPEKTAIQKALEHCQKFTQEHPVAIGVAEMALGAGIIYWGVQSGMIQIGSDLAGSKLAEIGGSISASVGAVATPLIAETFLKSIFIGGVSGVAGVTMVPAIPVIALIGGGAAVFGAFGYTATDMIQKFFEPSFSDYVAGASVVSIGIALMVDGARRLIKDERVLGATSSFHDGLLSLKESSGEIVAKSWDDLQRIIAELAPQSPEDGMAKGASVIAGAAIGGSLAAGSVTVLGSHALGAAALSLGIVSAPVWPIVAGGAIGLAVGAAALKGVKSLNEKRLKDVPPPEMLPPGDSES